MLRNIIGDYLDNLRERDFDLPFISLLSVMGFFDVHKVHGIVEYGKDFIAKKNEGGLINQYSFQVKAGNISQGDWQSSIQGQMLQSVLSGLNHPNFDESLPHIPVLVIIGEFTPPASLSVRNFSQQLKDEYDKPMLVCWTKENLLDYLINSNFEEFYLSTNSHLIGYGKFFELYGKVVDGNFDDKEFETHSRDWLIEKKPINNVVLGSVLETEILSNKAENAGLIYESFKTFLCLHRFILFEIFVNQNDGNQINYLLEIHQGIIIKLITKAKGIYYTYKRMWEDAGKQLVKIIDGPGIFFTYLVHFCRVLEISGFLFFLDKEIMSEVTTFLLEFISQEPGTRHIPSDNYAISIILPCLSLIEQGEISFTQEFIKDITVWLCDRFEDGIGLGSFGSTEFDEVKVLLGEAFDFIDTSRNGSFLAALISDLSIFLGNKEFYEDVLNDISAVNISYNYWQVNDTKGMFIINGEDIITYPGIDYREGTVIFSEYTFADHIMHEVIDYSLSDFLDVEEFVPTLILLLRDRYFPTLWRKLIKSE